MVNLTFRLEGPDENGDYNIQCPERPELTANGATPDEAVYMLAEVLEAEADDSGPENLVGIVGHGTAVFLDEFKIVTAEDIAELARNSTGQNGGESVSD